MMSQMKPMLAANHDPSKLVDFPYYASPKIDGYRCFNDSGVPLTRSRKTQPNVHIYSRLSHHVFSGLDGELVCGDITDPEVFQNSSGDLRSKSARCDWSWHIFDDFTDPSLPFKERLASVQLRVEAIRDLGYDNVHVVEQVLIHTLEELDAFEAKCLALGFEGVMLKPARGRYKYGRSTVNEGYCLKVKRYDFEEAEVTGIEELMHNENESFVNELGNTARTSHQDNLVGSGMAGALVCERLDIWPGVKFNVSCGTMKHDDKKALWEEYKRTGKLPSTRIRFKHFAHGAKDRPRHALFNCWLEEAGASHE